MNEISLSSGSKSEKYEQLLPQIQSLIADDAALTIAALGNVCAALKETFGWWWVGFYLIDTAKNELQLSAFQGPIACTRIAKGRGVCGQAWAQARAIVVENVHEYPDHIACSSRSQSEIVIPLYHQSQEIIGILDVDSEHLAHFDDIDAHYLTELCRILRDTLFRLPEENAE